jgi:primosomal protein N' (replication factor Y)
MKTSQQSTKTELILRVAIPSPLRRLFDYVLPDSDLEFVPTIGARVEVPFGRRTLVGIIAEITDTTECPTEKLKAIYKILDPQPLFSEKLRDLFIWASNYYQYPLGLLFDSVLPAWLRKQKNLDFKTKAISYPPLVNSLDLNSAQQHAVEQIQAAFGKFQAFLVDGITGSGKTEVYMQLISTAIKHQLQTLILIPEINLTPQTLERFQERFHVPIAVLHSQISEKARAQAWLQAKDGTAPIVLGTRLAAFTPLKNPGLFIIDEEHDLSFKQQDHFRYSARDLLLKRAQLEECPIVLGTATPALETWHNVTNNRYQQLELPERAGNAQRPEIQIIDIRHKKLDNGLSNDLLAQIKDHLDNNSQVLLFLNRRGYAPVLMCFKCDWHQTCKRCDSNMIVHYHNQTLRCHHCEAQGPIPKVCPKCADSGITAIGLGTQRIEASLAQHFPQAKIARVDRDTVQTKKQLQAVLDAVHDGSTNILIGTQMLAKGHHFPNLSLVAIVDIDSALFSADFRATERIGQLITQVAGRSGRGNKLGKVLLQTSHPEHPLITTLSYKSYHEFLDLLMHERKAAKLPPFSYQILIRAETKTPAKANNFLKIIKLLVSQNTKAIHCLGPIPAPMEKRQGFYRAQLLLQADNRQILQSMLQEVTPQIEAHKLANSTRWSIDVDPLDMY